MATLITITRPMMVELHPRTLYDFSRYLLESAGSDSLEADKELAAMDEDWEQIPEEEANEELAAKFQGYRDKVVGFIQGLAKDASSDKEVQTLILLDDMRRCCGGEDHLDTLEAMSGIRHAAGLPALEYAARVLLKKKDPDLFNRVAKKVKRPVPVGYHYYIPEEGSLFTVKQDAKVGDALNAALKESIDASIAEQYKTKVCVVRSEEVGGRWYIEVCHGGMKQKTESEKDAQTKDVVLQPLEIDSIVYNTTTHDIKVRMAKHKIRIERDTYVPALAGYLTDNALKWTQEPKFSLSKFNVPKEELNELLQRAGEAMSSAQLGNVSITITEVSYEQSFQNDEGVFVSNVYTVKNKVLGLNYALSAGERLVESGIINHVSFSLHCPGLKNRKGGSIPIALTDKTLSESPLSVDFEAWLDKEGIGYTLEQDAQQGEAQDASDEQATPQSA